MAGEPIEAVIALERSIELGREARTALEQESLRVAVLSEALLSAGDGARALEAAEESVALARERGNEAILAVCYRVLAEALLAGEGSGKVAAAEDALEKATAAAEATGSRSELPFIARARFKLSPQLSGLRSALVARSVDEVARSFAEEAMSSGEEAWLSLKRRDDVGERMRIAHGHQDVARAGFDLVERRLQVERVALLPSGLNLGVTPNEREPQR